MLSYRFAALTPLVLLAAACGGGSVSGNQSSVGTDLVALKKKTTLFPLPSPTPTPSATPSSGPTAAAAGYVQLASIPSNFDRQAELEVMGIPGTNAPDTVGAFRMTCKASHNAYDDPIVFPGQPGASHLHTFFGNTTADAFSTYASLRTAGDSTCHSKLNRSAYWIPALMNGRGQVVMPDYLAVYYKRFPADSTACAKAGICIPMPRGLRMVFGRSMTDASSNQVYFNCTGPGAVSGIYPTMAEAARNCPSGAQLIAVNNAPTCWNGTELDSADHRSHLAYLYYDPAIAAERCPATHPFVIPHFILSAAYTTDDTLDRSGSTDPDLQTWYFASDRMAGMPNKPSGATYHADWFGAWDDPTLEAWQTNCIDKLLSCTTGNLGDGTGMKWPTGFAFKADQRLVDPPARVTTAMLCTGKRKLDPTQRNMIRAIRRKLDQARENRTMLANAQTPGRVLRAVDVLFAA